MIYKKLPNINASVVTITSTASSLEDLIKTASSSDFSVNNLDGLDYNIESGSIRVTFDSNTPTADEGLLLSGSGSFRFKTLSFMKLISISGDVSMSIQVGKCEQSDTNINSGPVSSSEGGGGLTNPMPNGTFLQTIDKDDNVIPVAGYFSEVLAFGDYEFGNESFLASSDNFTTFFSALTVGQESISMGIEDTANNKDFSYEVNNPNKEVTWRYETALDDGTGMIVAHAFLADNADANNILINEKYVGLNDTGSSIDYSRTEYGIVDATATAESGYKKEFIIIEGAETEAQTIDTNGITNHLVTRLSARLVTPDTTPVVEYVQVESNVGSDTYHTSICGGTTVPTDTETGFTRGCQFIRATVGDAEIYFNLGNSTSCKFRKATII